MNIRNKAVGYFRTLLDNPEYNQHTFPNRVGLVSENSVKHEMPLGSPYCAEPNCAYCKELRELEEELRRKERPQAVSADKAENCLVGSKEKA